MMRPFLAGFHGADGRSLARALALLLVVSGCFGALHSGRMAADAADGTVLCGANGVRVAGPGEPIMPLDADYGACCVLGCAVTAFGIATAAGGQPAIPPRASDVGGHNYASPVIAIVRPTIAGPRGPPVLA